LKNYKQRLLKSIPGGAHTYSRGYDQFPDCVPDLFQSGKGAYLFDEQGSSYLDYGMALRAVHLGYSEKKVDEAAYRQILNGNNLTKPSLVELEAAELLIDLIDSVDMVKFTKNGSTAVSAAVKLSRAYTGRDKVARCSDQPFLSYDDWFISSTPITKGIPKSGLNNTLKFQYNNIESLEVLIQQNHDEIACVVLEPSSIEHPVASVTHSDETFLHDVKRLCKKHNIVFVLDEMITGFRWALKGAQDYYKVTSDLCTFGKAMANGFSVAAVAGKREIMELGSIEIEGAERVFLLSTTHGAEMSGLGAFKATVSFMREHNVVEHLWKYGKRLKNLINTTAASNGLSEYIVVGGVDCSPYFLTYDQDKKLSLPFRTLFVQEMFKNGVLMPWIALCYKHGEQELNLTAEALDRAFKVYKSALENGYEQYLVGDIIKPVFRRFN
jgi:glutamate-1-semialdehyde 2,1-aminomutase